MFEINKDQVKDKVDAGFNQQEVKFKAIEAQVGELKKVIAIAAPSLMTRTRGTTIRFRGRTVPGVTWSLMRPPSWVSAAQVTSCAGSVRRDHQRTLGVQPASSPSQAGLIILQFIGILYA